MRTPIARATSGCSWIHATAASDAHRASRRRAHHRSRGSPTSSVGAPGARRCFMPDCEGARTDPNLISRTRRAVAESADRGIHARPLVDDPGVHICACRLSRGAASRQNIIFERDDTGRNCDERINKKHNTAAVLVIGDEIPSGPHRDKNIGYRGILRFIQIGIDLARGAHRARMTSRGRDRRRRECAAPAAAHHVLTTGGSRSDATRPLPLRRLPTAWRGRSASEYPNIRARHRTHC